ncbi:beta-ketoacyl synthase N-terminal-like domain-containing protein [uncultured Desulfobacter sp.]|uniref:beta-ketoacyl synthase N-terminal-like domain-containing protein n=1 Tax=uncultured Desulfobacter sp. TaxID=240139 RepID=UPI002AAC06D4|nr:beta-ketoacyl synthase N-terminal-like domain-containing protein [uncultured Desulfobacter sp.]
MTSKAEIEKQTPCSPRMPIAIIGMGCIFPESRNLKEFWKLIFNGVDAITDIPEETHWRLKDYFNEDPSCPDHTYCSRGGFLPDIAFDPLTYGIPPKNIDATDTSQLLGLEVVRMALADAGYPAGHVHLKEKRVNVIIGVTGTQELVIPLGARLGHPFWKNALDAAGIAPDKKASILKMISDSYVSWQENSFPGLLGNVVAGRIANRMDLSGTNTVCDAACASSFSAIHTAMMELETGRCDMSITGGVDTLNDIFMHMCFSKTGVLSHTSDARPFSKDADGTVLGEGIGLLVLKRLEDARRDKDRIYAVIKGMGTSSDGRTSAIYAPEAKGQIRALENAYSHAGILPESVGLIEAHGTGTRVGDKVEFTALKEFFHNKPTASTALGSVKSMIGHSKAAAGAAGIIKAALALHHKIIPPTLKAQTPDPDLDIQNSPFYLNQVSRPWVGNDRIKSLRSSGVSAFGFGGSNFHAVLEEYSEQKTDISWDGSVQILALSAESKEAVVEKLDAIVDTIKAYDARDRAVFSQAIAWQASLSRKAFVSNHDVRLLILLTDQDDIFERLTQAKLVLTDSQPAKPPVFLGKGSASGKLGFLFPGQGSQYTGMAGQIMSIFPESLEILGMAQTYVSSTDAGLKDDVPLDAYMYPSPEYAMDKKAAEEALRQTRIAQPAIGTVSLAMLEILSRFKVVPHMTCGHSYGELCALYAAGWIDAKTCLELSAARGNFMAKAGQSAGDSGSMLAIQAPIEKIEALIEEEKLDLVLANRNSLSQGVLSGETRHILKAEEICKIRRMRAIKLPVAAAFHSRLVADAAAPFNELTRKAAVTPTPIKVLSNTTGSPYPGDPAQAQDLLGQQLMHPVDFIGNIKQMHEQGVDTFVEIGPKSVLCSLAKSILKDQDVQTIALDKSMGKSAGKNSGIQDLAVGLCAIAAAGHPVDLSAWEEDATRPEPKKLVIMLNGANPKPPTPKMSLSETTFPEKKQAEQTPVNTPVQPSQFLAGQQPKNEKNVQQSSVYTTGSIQQTFTTQGKTMTSFPHPEFKASPSITTSNSNQFVTGHQIPANPDILVQGLNAIQQLQAQTARAHEKFLETQAQASNALAALMSQTRGQVFVQAPANPVIQPPAPVQAMPYQQVQIPEPVPAAAAPVQKAAPQPKPVNIQQPQPTAVPNPTPPSPVPAVKNVLFDIVSRLTGFPVEMLEPEMNIESDLGIDSIKKVEIISELEKAFPGNEAVSAQSLGSVKTLADICAAVETDQAPAPVVKQTAVPVVHEPKNNRPAQNTLGILVNIISELTGFPKEMLEPGMNLESDLGIDSIKRVEILSRLEQEQPESRALSPDDMGSLKTIADIVNYLTPGQTKVSKEATKKKLRMTP